jgi:dihydrofolate reductase
MPDIVLFAGISLDGYIEGPNQEIDWHLVDDEVHRYFNEVLGSMAGFLSGRVTHQLMAEFWPTADEDPSSPEVMKEFARIWRDMPKIVYSRTLTHADWNTTIVREVVPEEVAELKRRADGDLVLGGADLAAAFLRHGLVDQFHLSVHPVTIGRGKPLFPESDQRTRARLMESRTFGNGVVVLRYSVTPLD